MTETYQQACEWAEHNGWAIGLNDFLVFLECHLEGTRDGDENTVQFVEDVLEECNFHTELKLFHEHRYAAALANYLGE